MLLDGDTCCCVLLVVVVVVVVGTVKAWASCDAMGPTSMERASTTNTRTLRLRILLIPILVRLAPLLRNGSMDDVFLVVVAIGYNVM